MIAAKVRLSILGFSDSVAVRMALTASVVQSGRSLASPNPELVVERPEGFRMAIDNV